MSRVVSLETVLSPSGPALIRFAFASYPWIVFGERPSVPARRIHSSSK